MASLTIKRLQMCGFFVSELCDLDRLPNDLPLALRLGLNMVFRLGQRRFTRVLRFERGIREGNKMGTNQGCFPRPTRPFSPTQVSVATALYLVQNLYGFELGALAISSGSQFRSAQAVIRRPRLSVATTFTTIGPV